MTYENDERACRGVSLQGSIFTCTLCHFHFGNYPPAIKRLLRVVHYVYASGHSKELAAAVALEEKQSVILR